MSQDLPEFDPDILAVRDPDGTIVLQGALIGTLYFESGHSFEKREAAARCFEQYRDHVGDQLRWAHPGKRGFEPVTGTPTKDPARRLIASDLNENKGWEFTWHGGETPEDANSVMICALGTRKWESPRNPLSFLTFALPIDRPNAAESLSRLLMSFSNRLRPVHGYGGYGLVESPNRFRSARYEPLIPSIVQRYVGLEYDEPILHSLCLKDGIKGANWLTILGPRWEAALGGSGHLRCVLPSECALTGLEEGVIIQAGASPQLGDVMRGSPPTIYGSVARAVKPVRVQGHARMGWLSMDEFNAWLARLDDLKT